uniref:HET domain protein pin-c1 n=1 Tax=Neurospora crassa TaxID=5141 RepID=R4H5E9_NEUCS|nr:HET domain protein pin-c1 [Neurospora crassa]
MTPRLCAYCSHVPYWLASLPWPTTKSESQSPWRLGVDPVITLGSWRWMEAQAAIVQAAMTAEAEARKEAGKEAGKEVAGKEVTGEVAGEKEEAGTGRTQTDYYLDQETDKMKRGKKESRGNEGNGKSEEGQEEQGGGRKREENYRQEKMEGGCHLCLLITKYTDRASRVTNISRPYYLPPVMNPRTDEWAADVPLVFGRRGIWRPDSERKEDGRRGKWDWRIECLNNEELFGADLVKVPGSWCPKFQPPMGYNDQNPENNILLLKDWLRYCQRNHTQCREIRKTSMDTDTDFLPTRLLDVQAFGTGNGPPSHLGDDVKLVCLSLAMGPGSDTNEFPPPYLTLSHCWGPPEKRPATTTKANLTQRMERIPFIELPRTFRDAIEITRKLGHRYLWIDSLCIIQDDEQDWAYEAALMAKIYSHAFCMLSALSSNDSSEGLRLEPLDEDSSYMDLMTTSHASPAGGSGIIKSDMDESFIWFRISIHLEAWDIIYGGKSYHDTISPLCTRAWTLQESRLSRRVIYFAKHQVLWMCEELEGTAQRPWNHPIYSAWGPELLFKEWPGLKERLESLTLVQDRDGNPVPSAVTVTSLLLAYRGEWSWWEMVRDYSSRLITKVTDRLPALSGLAKFHQRNYFSGQRYVAGLWSARLEKELLWDVRSNLSTQRPAEFIAPSWSWASIDGGVNLTQWDPDLRFKLKEKKLSVAGEGDPADAKDKDRDREEEVGRAICEEWKVEEINLVPKYDDPYGALKGGSLIIGGARLVEVEFSTDFMEVPDPNSSLGYAPHFGGLKIGDRWVADHVLDIKGEVEGGCILWCLAMEEYAHYRRMTVIEGLILREERLNDDEDICVYSRVGKFRDMAVALFAGVEPRRIKLI